MLSRRCRCLSYGYFPPLFCRTSAPAKLFRLTGMSPLRQSREPEGLPSERLQPPSSSTSLPPNDSTPKDGRWRCIFFNCISIFIIYFSADNCNVVENYYWIRKTLKSVTVKVVIKAKFLILRKLFAGLRWMFRSRLLFRPFDGESPKRSLRTAF